MSFNLIGKNFVKGKKKISMEEVNEQNSKMNSEKIEEQVLVNDNIEQQQVDGENVEKNNLIDENKDEHKKSKKKNIFSKKTQSDNSEEIIKLKNSITELNDKLLRNAAEFDNYKKRTLKEKSDLLKYGSESTLLALLQIVDDFDRANKSINESTDIEAVKTGINLIYSKFNEFLNQQGIKEINAVNQLFNTDLHEAITRFPAQTEDLKGKVIDVVQKGYTLNDKVIRFAKVVVGE